MASVALVHFGELTFFRETTLLSSGYTVGKHDAITVRVQHRWLNISPFLADTNV